jgi:hypothetical protein
MHPNRRTVEFVGSIGVLPGYTVAIHTLLPLAPLCFFCLMTGLRPLRQGRALFGMGIIFGVSVYRSVHSSSFDAYLSAHVLSTSGLVIT